MSSFPIYILDNDTICISEIDIPHPEFWKKEIAKKYSTPLAIAREIPYCQRRGRIVNDKLYCGERLNNKLLNKIRQMTNQKLELIYDEHETRTEYDVSIMKSYKLD